MKSLNELFSKDVARFAQKSLDYLDGKQHEHVVELLDDANSGRAQWREKGLRVVYRNITRKIIAKSGLLYIDGAPALEVWDGDQVNEDQTARINEILSDSEFNEFMINFDSVIRLLKTGLVLVQYDEYSDSIILDALHRGNCHVRYDPITKRPVELIYKTHTDEENVCHYRIFTQFTIEDWAEKRTHGSLPYKVQEIENPYQMIPAAVFYDTNLPRTGFWYEAPKELIMFNEMLNIHMVDLEYAASWAVHQTLFTNCLIEGEDVGYGDTSEQYGQKLPRGVSNGNEVIGGLGKIVQLDTTGVDNPFVEYKGPSVDLSKSHELFKDWVKDYADDWSVKIRVDGDGSANVSGFSLVVQSTDNLELRKERQRMAENGLQRLMKVIGKVWNIWHPNSFGEDVSFYADFTQPKLPFDQKEDEELWEKKIASGRASVIDYLMEKHDMSREEATEKAMEIQVENKLVFGTNPEQEVTDEEN